MRLSLNPYHRSIFFSISMIPTISLALLISNKFHVPPEVDRRSFFIVVITGRLELFSFWHTWYLQKFSYCLYGLETEQ